MLVSNIFSSIVHVYYILAAAVVAPVSTHLTCTNSEINAMGGVQTNNMSIKENETVTLECHLNRSEEVHRFMVCVDNEAYLPRNVQQIPWMKIGIGYNTTSNEGIAYNITLQLTDPNRSAVKIGCCYKTGETCMIRKQYYVQMDDSRGNTMHA